MLSGDFLNLISSHGVTIFLTWDLNIVRRIVIILTFSMISPAKQLKTPKISRFARIFSVGVLIITKSQEMLTHEFPEGSGFNLFVRNNLTIVFSSVVKPHHAQAIMTITHH